jgi:hypothetical protein
VTRAGNLFTTHTPVDAGFDRFDTGLMERYLRPYAEHELAIGFDELLALGRRDVGNSAEPFNMAYLLHGAASRRVFQPLFSRWPEVEVPISHVTNGVHMPTWDSADADSMWERACGKEALAPDYDDVETARFLGLEVSTSDDRHLFALVDLGEVDAEAAQVELYAEGGDGGEPERLPMIHGGRLPGLANGLLYSAEVPSTRPSIDYTPRLRPVHADATVPLEVPLILWYEGPR